MKIEFLLLWVDDNKDFVDSLKPQLKTFLKKEGLTLEIRYHPNEAKVYDDLKAYEIELIILDYKLKGKTRGDAIISKIRDEGCVENIIFYTTGSNPNDIFKLSPDGVFFVDRADAKDRIIDLIKSKIKKMSDIATLRGWIVADSIELEIIIGRVLAKFFKEMEDLFKERFLMEEGLFDFGKKHKILNGILKDMIAKMTCETPKNPSLEHLKRHKSILDKFPKEIIEIRNALAHQKAEITNDGQKKIRTRTKDATEIIITLERCAEIRKNIRKHWENLCQLEKLVSSL